MKKVTLFPVPDSKPLTFRQKVKEKLKGSGPFVAFALICSLPILGFTTGACAEHLNQEHWEHHHHRKAKAITDLERNCIGKWTVRYHSSGNPISYECTTDKRTRPTGF